MRPTSAEHAPTNADSMDPQTLIESTARDLSGTGTIEFYGNNFYRPIPAAAHSALLLF